MNNQPEITEPVAYLWVGGDTRQEALLKQVADFCGYELKDAEHPDGVEPSEIWPKVWQAIRYISNITCWTDTDLETFLLSTRTQIYHAKQICACRPGCCKCDGDMIVIPVEYAPYPDNPFVSGKISVVIGGKVTTKDLTAEYLNEHFDHDTGKLYIMRDDFPDELLYNGNCCCLCRRDLAIVLKYNAGYTDIPDGILPLICPIVAKIDEAKLGMSNCHQAMTQVVGLLKRKKVGNVEYEWSNTDTDSARTQGLYTDIYNLASLDEIMALSRCYMIEEVSEIGDVV